MDRMITDIKSKDKNFNMFWVYVAKYLDKEIEYDYIWKN